MSFSAPLVIGMGSTGMSCVRFLDGSADVSVYDTRSVENATVRQGLRSLRSEFPNVRVFSGAQLTEALEKADVLISSPGIRSSATILQEARNRNLPVLSDIDLFTGRVDVPVIAITGTNGKSTVTEIAGRMLVPSGFRHGGNLGIPVLDILDTHAKGYVVELSSFQLEHTHPCRFEVGAILNVADDHLDRHGTRRRYLEAKRRIYRDCGFAIFNGKEAWTRPPDSIPSLDIGTHPEWRVTSDGAVIAGNHVSSADINIKGRHNRFNAVMASAIAHQMGVEWNVITQTLAEFEGLPHRAQVVRERHGVHYIDDSKATNVSAAIATIEGFGTGERHLIVLLGGDAKGADFEPLAQSLRKHVKRAICFGRDGARIAEAIVPFVATTRIGPMHQAVLEAVRVAISGDIVMLSPACASFDEFRDYRHRGNVFCRMVNALPS